MAIEPNQFNLVESPRNSVKFNNLAEPEAVRQALHITVLDIKMSDCGLIDPRKNSLQKNLFSK